MVNRLLLLLPLLTCNCIVHSQDTVMMKPKLVSSYISNAEAKAGKLEAKLDKYMNKALLKWQQREAHIKAKLAKSDSISAVKIFADSKQRYQDLQDKLKGAKKLHHYIPSLDTLTTSIKFLQQNENLLSGIGDGQKKLADALTKIREMENQFQKAEEVKKFIKERKQYLQQQLKGLGLTRELKKINKQAYYYSEQLKEYKTLLKDHKKAERKALQLLTKTKLFRDFMSRNSYLASFFRVPDDPNSIQANLSGLQTRSQVSNLIQQQITAGGPNAQQQFQQNLQQAQAQINQLKNKLNQLGGGSSDAEMPDGFVPNDQKVKSLLKRIEVGINIQSQRERGYLPSNSEIGLFLGYKLNDRSIIGLGGGYRIGWGKNIRHIEITNQGVNLRCFLDYKLKSSLWLTGGYEVNYRSQFRNIDELRDGNAWQQSGLIGISKTISLKTKFFKKTKLQLLWDFLSYQQIPKTQPVLFRVGYSF